MKRSFKSNEGGQDSLCSVPHLTPFQLFCYGALSMPIAMGGLILFTFIPTYYAVDMGLGLTLVGAIFVFGRFFDVLTDPLIGFLSDRTRSRFGQRRPWMVLSLPFFLFAVWMLFMPGENPSAIYLLIFSSLYFFFYTALDVPYSSVGLEISPYHHERSILASTKSVFQVLGAITASLLFAGNIGASLETGTGIIAALSLPCLILFLLCVPRRDRIISKRPIDFWTPARRGLQNPAYRMMIIAFGTVQTANALTAGLSVLYITHVIKAPQFIGLFFGVLFTSSAIFLPLWIWLSKRTSKSRAWQIAILSGCAALSGALFLGEEQIIPVFIFGIIIGGTFGCDAIMPTSILADIVSVEDELTESRNGGLYLAFKNAVSKLTFIAPMGIAFPLLDVVDFKTGGEENSTAALWILICFFAVVPIFLRLLTAWMAGKIPQVSSA